MAYNNSYNNNITKRQALEFIRSYNKGDIAEEMYKALFLGNDYQYDYMKSNLEMSYFCRAYSITQEGKSKRQNQIKNRYKKYANNKQVVEYFKSLIMDNNGFSSENPTMDERLEAFLRQSSQQNYQTNPVVGNHVVSGYEQFDYYSNDVSNNSYGGNSYSGSSSVNFAGLFKGVLSVIGVLAGIVAIIALIIFAKNIFGFAGTGKVGKLRDNFGSSYQVEAYEYDGKNYLGGKALGKPRGVNLYVSRGIDSYEMGEYKNGKKSGEGIKYDGATLKVGLMKNNEFTGSWCVSKKANEVKLAEYKKGNPSGVGLYRSDGCTQIVDYNKSMKVIATYQNGSWVKPNGKTLKLKKGNVYKGMELTDDVNVTVGGIEFDIDENKPLLYDSTTFYFNGTGDDFDASYYSEEDTINITVKKGVSARMEMNGLTQMWLTKQ